MAKIKCYNHFSSCSNNMALKIRGTFRKVLGLFLFIFILTSISPDNISARKGCCSWHGGVCGCDTSVGRQVCCDGTYSPSCTCAYVPPSTPKPTKQPTPKPTPTPIPKPTPTLPPSPTPTPEVQGEQTSKPTQSPSSQVLSDSSSESAFNQFIGFMGWSGLALFSYLIYKNRKNKKLEKKEGENK